MNDQYEARKGKGKPHGDFSLLFSKIPRVLPNLTSPPDERIAIKSAYAFTSHLGLKLGMKVLPHHPS